MKKSEYKKLVIQQANTIQKLKKENDYLRGVFENARKTIMGEIQKMMGVCDD